MRGAVPKGRPQRYPFCNGLAFEAGRARIKAGSMHAPSLRTDLFSARMGEPLIQVRDPTRLHCLVMPPLRSGGMSAPARPPAVQSSAISFPWMQAPAQAQGVCVESGCDPSVPACALNSGSCSGGGGAACSSESVMVPGWATPGGYAICGLGLGLCNLLAPGYIQTCAHLLCPVWTLSLALHIVGNPAHSHDSAWVWSGVLTLLLLPFVILVGSPLFVGFYLLVFAAFSSGLFWRRLHGAAFILAWVCWGGLLLSCGLSVGVGLPPAMHLCIAAFFSISLGVIGSGGGKFVMRAG